MWINELKKIIKMLAENNTSVNIMDCSGLSSIKSGVNNISILEEDLALSSSTLASSHRTDKTCDDNEHEYVQYKSKDKVIYLNEDTMDCNYSESTGTPKIMKSTNVVCSPELFDSDDDDGDDDDEENVEIKSTFNRILSQSVKVEVSPQKPSQDELIRKSDRYLLSKMNKFLTGVPPPPKHTICQNDCADFLACIRQNREYFWVDPLIDEKSSKENVEKRLSPNIQQNEKLEPSPYRHPALQRGRNNGLRNLTDAFDACDFSNSSGSTLRADENNDCSNQTSNTDISMCTETMSNRRISLTESETTSLPPISHSNQVSKDIIKRVTFEVPEEENLAIYCTIDETHAKNLPWTLAYQQRAHGIHYNRNRYVEDFENLTLKFCQRYIGNETQSTCTSWFTKQAPNSVKKRSAVGRRNIGQSPGKRLSHLARRRRTFSSANLLGMAEKRQLTLNLKKPTLKKGKSPRGKSPRNSAKKRLARRLSMDGPSPRKTKLETSKRALFQSPPTDRAGPSRITSQVNNPNNPHKIKRALFPTPKKKDENTGEENRSGEESKKRKNEEELQGPKFKWAKSLSFDCAHNLENSKESWAERYSTGTMRIKSETFSQPTGEMSDINRKKLLWAVSEALRSKGVHMTHPKFKQYATQLAKTVKKYMPDLENRNIPRKPGSTTDRMLKLAKNHVILIVDAN